MQKVTGFNTNSVLLRWRVYVPRMRLDAQSGSILLGDEQEVPADVHRLRIGQVNVSSPGALLPEPLSIGRAGALVGFPDGSRIWLPPRPMLQYYSGRSRSADLPGRERHLRKIRPPTVRVMTVDRLDKSGIQVGKRLGNISLLTRCDEISDSCATPGETLNSP